MTATSLYLRDGSAPKDTIIVSCLPKDQRITVGTYNILMPQWVAQTEIGELYAPKYSTLIGYDKIGETIQENSKRRLEIIKKNILDSHLDVICLQEVVEDIFKDLQEGLSKNYEGFWMTHSAHNYGHGLAIFFKKEVFKKMGEAFYREKIKVDNFNPEEPPFEKDRIFLLLDLQNKTTGLVFRVATFHFCDNRTLQENVGSQARSLVNFVGEAEYQIDRTLLLGDTNLDQYGNQKALDNQSKCEAKHWYEFPQYEALKEKAYTCGTFKPSEYAVGEIGESPISTGRSIDRIFSQGAILRELNVHSELGGSDHALIAATVL
jgi:endonuclease/exonuclease/phosphatase family metal-dependent hydrolase